jgi:hypothetical protein
VTVRAELLRERSTFTPAAVLPALVLAHRIYQDATRVDELVARNARAQPELRAGRAAGGAAVSDSTSVQLVVNGRSFEGWKEMRVRRSIEQMAGAFVLKATLKWSEDQDDPFEIREGLPCQVLIGQDVVITGYIEEYEPSYDAEESTVAIHGRDKTGDLVDCAAIFKTGQWHNVGLLQIVQDIAQPFGIGVVVATAWTWAMRSSRSLWRKARRRSARSTARAACAACCARRRPTAMCC